MVLSKPQVRNSIVLPEWLVFTLDHKIFIGLIWADRKDGTFFVYSTHERSSNWNKDKAAHCIGWSMIKGHSEGKENRNFKAGFRTAINSRMKKNPQFEKIRQYKTKSGTWIKYRFLDKRFLNKEEENPYFVNYYFKGQGKFSSSNASISNQGESSSKASLPPFAVEFKNFQRNKPEKQKPARQRYTSKKIDVQTSTAKGTKPVRNRKSGEMKQKNKVQKHRDLKNETFTTIQNSPDSILPSKNSFASGKEMVKSPLPYWDRNPMTPEPQANDVCFEEKGYQDFHSFANQENQSAYTEYQPYTPMSYIGDTQEAFSPNIPQDSPNSLHCTYRDTQEAFSPNSPYVPQDSPNSLHCTYNPAENSFYHSMPIDVDQKECVPPHYQAPFYTKAESCNSFPPIHIERTFSTHEHCIGHLPGGSRNEDLFEEAYQLLVKSGLL